MLAPPVRGIETSANEEETQQKVENHRDPEVDRIVPKADRTFVPRYERRIARNDAPDRPRDAKRPQREEDNIPHDDVNAMHWRWKCSRQPKVGVAYHTNASRYDATQRRDCSHYRSGPQASRCGLNRTRGS